MKLKNYEANKISKLGKNATTVSEQIKLLKSRGLILDFPDEKIEEILLDIGYYRLGFYWNPFEKDKKHNFQSNSKFSDITALYYLDVDLRNSLLKCLNRIEINFRTRLIYTVSNFHKKTPTWFASKSIMESWFIDSLPKFYNKKFKENNLAIRHHHKKYINDKYAPAWKTLEFFSFGTILQIFRAVKNEELKKEIASYYEIKTFDKLENHFRVILTIRNICAHGGVLFDTRTPKGISYIPDLKFNTGDRHSLDASIKLIAFYLGKISENRKTEFLKRIDAIFNNKNISDDLKTIIANKAGYKYL